MVLLRIENSKNDRLKVILLYSMLTFSQTATSNITFSLSFLLKDIGFVQLAEIIKAKVKVKS